MYGPIGTLIHENSGVTVRLAGGAGCGFSFMVVDAAGCDVVGLSLKADAIDLCDALAKSGLTLRPLADAFAAEDFAACRRIYAQLFDACRRVFLVDRFYAAGRKWANQETWLDQFRPAAIGG